MENVKELIPLAREMLSQKPSRALVKLYLLGSVCAALGTAIGMLESLCQPFSSGTCLDTEIMLLMKMEERTAQPRTEWLQEEEEKEEEEKEEEEKGEEEEEEEKAKEAAEMELPLPKSMAFHKTHTANQRSAANRLHAS